MGNLFHSAIPSILFSLMDGPKNGWEIKRDINMDGSMALKVLKNKKMKGLVERRQDKKWVLTEDGLKFAESLYECERTLSEMRLEGRI